MSTDSTGKKSRNKTYSCYSRMSHKTSWLQRFEDCMTNFGSMVFRLLRLRCRISSNNEVLDFAFDTNDYGKLSIRKNNYTAMFNTLPY